MVNIKLIIIGHADRVVDFTTTMKYKSKFLKYLSIDRINNLPPASKDDGYLDIVYTKDEVEQLLNDIDFDGICIAVMNYSFDDSFYLHRVGRNKVCISTLGIDTILSQKNISIENFIIKNTYEIFLFYKILNNLDTNEVYQFVHSDTRGCLFDLNGDKKDIIYNTEKPIICDECKGKISHRSIPENFLDDIQAELGRIRKPLPQRLELLIKKYPFLSILLTSLLAILINLVSSYIWTFITDGNQE